MRRDRDLACRAKRTKPSISDTLPAPASLLPLPQSGSLPKAASRTRAVRAAPRRGRGADARLRFLGTPYAACGDPGSCGGSAVDVVGDVVVGVRLRVEVRLQDAV